MTKITAQHHDHQGDEFEGFAAAVRARFENLQSIHGRHLFTVETSGDLYTTYLENLPADQRQHHTCHCCRRFIEQYGNLAVITDSGLIESVMWGAKDVPGMYQQSALALANQVVRGKISGFFVAKEKSWGIAQTGEWSHFAVTPPAGILHTSRSQTPYQVMAAKLQDFGTLTRAIAEFSRSHIAQALTLLQADALYRAEKVIGPARWLLSLHDIRQSAKGKAMRDNLTWLAVSTAPVGYCTPRSSMVGTLLEDIAAGMDFATVKKRFDAKMHPLQYQRAQVPASAGNIAQAEKLVEQLGIARSLERRFARLDEIQTIWKPAEQKPSPKAGGVFGHLQAKGETAPEALSVPAQAITFDKFRRTVLPTAKKIEFYLAARMSFCAIVTAVHSDAPPILQWDTEEVRNPFSWYVWNGGSTPSQWGLVAGTYVPVTGLTLKPSMWADEERMTNQGKAVAFLLDGAKESRTDAGMALFPETLKSDLHQVRSTIEAFSNAGALAGVEESSANGVLISSGTKDRYTVRVTSDIGVVHYTIDRWD